MYTPSELEHLLDRATHPDRAGRAARHALVCALEQAEAELRGPWDDAAVGIYQNLVWAVRQEPSIADLCPAIAELTDRIDARIIERTARMRRLKRRK